MFKIQIIEDEDANARAAYAGLIPSPATEAFNDVDISARIILAQKNYIIQRAKNIREAIAQINTFNPDLIIIDINLNDTYTTPDTGEQLENGIHLFRYLSKLQPESSKILFTNHTADPQYYNRLSVSERTHCIPKSISAGYEILASRISEYLRDISIRLINEAHPSVLKQIRKEVETNPWEDAAEIPVSIGTRKIKLKHLVLHKAKPEYDKTNAILAYDSPESELFEITASTPTGNELRDIWKPAEAQWLLEDFERNIYSLEKDRIEKQFKYLSLKIIGAHEPSSNMPSKFEFRLTEYLEKQRDFSSKAFKTKYINVMIIRRVIFLFEQVLDECAATKSKIKRELKYKLHCYVKTLFEETLSIIITNDQTYSQLGRSLCMSFTNLNSEDVRQKARVAEYKVFDFEKEYLRSAEYASFKQQIKMLITSTL